MYFLLPSNVSKSESHFQSIENIFSASAKSQSLAELFVCLPPGHRLGEVNACSQSASARFQCCYQLLCVKALNKVILKSKIQEDIKSFLKRDTECFQLCRCHVTK